MTSPNLHATLLSVNINIELMPDVNIEITLELAEKVLDTLPELLKVETHGLTQEDLGLKLGLTKSSASTTISRYEKSSYHGVKLWRLREVVKALSDLVQK